MSETRYQPYGQAYWQSGASQTEFSFTGQRMDGFGLMDYNARYYDPLLGRFISPDTIIPQPGNPLAWDRYAYGGNNPLRYTDPSGHIACDGEYSGDVCDQITSQDWKEVINRAYGWSTNGIFTNKELGMILDAGTTIENYITTTTGEWGRGWVRKHLGKAVFNQEPTTNMIADIIYASAFVFPIYDVNLRKGSYDSSTIVHELGHVLDNNDRSGIVPATFVGGGPADAMVLAMDGNPKACQPRLQCWSSPLEPFGYQWYIDNVAGKDPWNVREYGNNGVADDFAETFRWTIIDPQRVPFGRLMWMKTYLGVIP